MAVIGLGQDRDRPGEIATPAAVRQLVESIIGSAVIGTAEWRQLRGPS